MRGEGGGEGGGGEGGGGIGGGEGGGGEGGGGGDGGGSGGDGGGGGDGRIAYWYTFTSCRLMTRPDPGRYRWTYLASCPHHVMNGPEVAGAVSAEHLVVRTYCESLT